LSIVEIIVKIYKSFLFVLRITKKEQGYPVIVTWRRSYQLTNFNGVNQKIIPELTRFSPRRDIKVHSLPLLFFEDCTIKISSDMEKLLAWGVTHSDPSNEKDPPTQNEGQERELV